MIGKVRAKYREGGIASTVDAVLLRQGRTVILCVILMSVLNACDSDTADVDTTPPEITLVGGDIMWLEVGSDYIELGANAIDNVDGFVGVVVLGNVNNSILGDNIITYTAIDSANNASSTTRVVMVIDSTGPAITLVGATNQTLEVGSSYIEQGASALDILDGAVNVTVSGLVDNAILGEYVIKYTAIDRAKNSQSRTRIVTVIDTTAPMISLVGAMNLTLEIGTSYFEQGASALDILDGAVDVTVSGQVDNTVLGEYVITYTTIDSAENSQSTTRIVKVIDTTAPVISLVGATNQTLEAGSSYSEQGATATDALDGVVGVAISGVVNIAVLGSYSITYTAIDSGGHFHSMVRTVTVIDTTSPTISLVGAANITLEAGNAYVEHSVSASDNVNTAVAIIATGSVDVMNLGLYVISYQGSDASGNLSSTITRNITIADNTSPVITLNGNFTTYHEAGTAYVDAGAIANDNLDGTVTVSVFGTVNTSVLGTYTLHYNALDSQSNISTPVIRTVIVEDTTAPVITLNKAVNMTLGNGRVYKEYSASATDLLDGDLGVITTIDTVDVNTNGTYTLNYTATDITGNQGTAQRVVKIVDTRPFKMTFDVAAGDAITISKYGSMTFNFNIDWGDGSPELTGQTGSVSSGPLSAGRYTVSISGVFPRLYELCYGAGVNNNVVSIDDWGDNQWESLATAFLDCNINEGITLGTPDLLSAGIDTYITSMFQNSNFNQPVNNWDISSVVGSSAAFKDSAFNQSLSDWDVSKITDMRSMFAGSAFDQDLSSWNVAFANNMNYMFDGAALSVANYDALLIGWSTLPLLDTNTPFQGGDAGYSSNAATARQKLIDDWNWNFTDGGLVP